MYIIQILMFKKTSFDPSKKQYKFLSTITHKLFRTALIRSGAVEIVQFLQCIISDKTMFFKKVKKDENNLLDINNFLICKENSQQTRQYMRN